MGCVHSQHGWLVSAQCCLNSLRSLLNRRVFRPYDFGRVTVLSAPQHLDTLVARYFQFYHTEEVECTMLLLSGSCPFSSWPSSTSCDLPSQTVPQFLQDRKSTRLNSSHVAISYAV